MYLRTQDPFANVDSTLLILRKGPKESPGIVFGKPVEDAPTWYPRNREEGL